MLIPTFAYPGGKARLRRRLVAYFPTSGRRYIEPFAGRGNVFFLARSVLNFKHWLLNDLYTFPFFCAVQSVDFNLLPETVDRDAFQVLKAHAESPLAALLEPRVTYSGKGYAFGHSGRVANHIPYQKCHYIKMLEAARGLPAGVALFRQAWDRLPYGLYGPDDFVYFDPPYDGTAIGSYPNIDHEHLLSLLSTASFRWALSGYATPLYLSRLGPPAIAWERCAEIAATSGQSGQKRIECLWLSPSLATRERLDRGRFLYSQDSQL